MKNSLVYVQGSKAVEVCWLLVISLTLNPNSMCSTQQHLPIQHKFLPLYPVFCYFLAPSQVVPQRSVCLICHWCAISREQYHQNWCVWKGVQWGKRSMVLSLYGPKAVYNYITPGPRQTWSLELFSWLKSPFLLVVRQLPFTFSFFPFFLNCIIFPFSAWR